jgi:hypothetical protein
VLLLSLLLPAVLLVMLRLLERYERTLDKPIEVAEGVEPIEAPPGAVPHPRVMPLQTQLTEAVTETA